VEGAGDAFGQMASVIVDVHREQARSHRDCVYPSEPPLWLARIANKHGGYGRLAYPQSSVN